MNEQIKTEIETMKKWCVDNYCNGADTMVECWDDEDYANLFAFEGKAKTNAQAWGTLKNIAATYQDRQADARNSAF